MTPIKKMARWRKIRPTTFVSSGRRFFIHFQTPPTRNTETTQVSFHFQIFSFFFGIYSFSVMLLLRPKHAKWHIYGLWLRALCFSATHTKSVSTIEYVQVEFGCKDLNLIACGVCRIVCSVPVSAENETQWSTWNSGTICKDIVTRNALRWLWIVIG